MDTEQTQQSPEAQEFMPRGASMALSLLEAMASPQGELAELMLAHLTHVEEEHRGEVAYIVSVAVVLDIGLAMVNRVPSQTVLVTYLQAALPNAKHMLCSLAGMDEAQFSALCKDVSGYIKDHPHLMGNGVPEGPAHAGSESVH